MKALIDGDIVCYRCAAVCENAELGLAIWQTDVLLSRILEDIDSDDWKIFISGEENFRYELYPDYKANRRDLPKPKHLEDLRTHLVLEWDASIVNGYEADDAMAMEHTNDTIICSIDKDLLQLPGWHYNFVRGETRLLTELEGLYNFYYQVLVGDPTDNVKGCPGIGKAKAPRLLDKCQSEVAFYEAVVKAYQHAYKDSPDKDEWFRQLNLNAQLLYIRRSPEEGWKKPEQEAGVESSSLMCETDTSTVHGSTV